MNLFIVRHGHSPMQDIDHQRPLSEWGQHQAKQAGLFIQQNTENAPYILCSDATRTRQTAEQIAAVFNIDQCHAEQKFYAAGVGVWCDAIVEFSHHKSLILVGHNPTVSQLGAYLSGEDNLYFKPACVAQIELEINQDGLRLPAQLLTTFKPDAKPE